MKHDYVAAEWQVDCLNFKPNVLQKNRTGNCLITSRTLRAVSLVIKGFYRVHFHANNIVVILFRLLALSSTW